MRPRPLHHREDLIALLAPYAPSRACARAIHEGRTEVFGEFQTDEGRPMLLVRVTGRYRHWTLGVIIYEDQYYFRLVYPSMIDWTRWAGDQGRGHPLGDGDNPDLYARKRDDGIQETAAGSA